MFKREMYISDERNDLPLVAIVGRPNVGKSTLFNRLTGKWRSIVEDKPGITRDRLYGDCRIEGHDIRIMDTGGLQVETPSVVEKKMSEQAFRGIEKADFILFILDGRTGVTPLDREWIQKIRKIKKPKLFAINKIDTDSVEGQLNEFYELGVSPLMTISAEHKRHFSDLGLAILKGLKLEPKEYEEYEEEEVRHKKKAHDDDLVEKLEEGASSATLEDPIDDEKLLAIAISGRPNVGKSTLLNHLLSEERCIVDNQPGTTRDPIASIVHFKDKDYRFIDLAGIRKRAKTKDKVETFSVMQALENIENADLVLLLIDGVTGPTEQDAHVAGYAFENGKAIILIVNKWDEGQNKYSREDFVALLELKMNYLNQCPLLYISAKTGHNCDKIFKVIEDIRAEFQKKIKTSDLNKAFVDIVENHPLPVYKGQQIKMYYSTQVKRQPPTFLVFCNYPKEVHFSYQRYLTNALRSYFGYKYVPVRVVFKGRK